MNLTRMPDKLPGTTTKNSKAVLMAIEVADLGSFRDPGGRVFFHDGRVFRTVMPHVAEDFDFVENSGLIAKLEDEGRIVTSRKVEPAQFGQVADGAHYVLEHPCLPFISYPYEWSFPALKIAALAHLDIHIQALEYGYPNGPRPRFSAQEKTIRVGKK